LKNFKPVCDNERGNLRILTNKEINAVVKKPTITETIRLNRLRWFGHVQRMKKIEFPKEYNILIGEQQDCEVDQEVDGKMK